MPNIEKIAKEISDFEGFEVTIRSKSRNGVAKLPGYKRRFQRRARESNTVADWKRLRFETDYPELEVDVLLADGRIATARTTLDKIRRSYE
jgi:hypothetical protein